MKWLSIAACSLIADQITKYIVVTQLVYGEQFKVLPFFSWVRFHNEGAAFSVLASAGPWKHWFFVVLAAGFSAYLIYELARLKPEERALRWVFALILGGALGNLTDRLVHGHVIDFIYFNYQSYAFPAFNIADSSLFCGAALWILLIIAEYRQAKRASASD